MQKVLNKAAMVVGVNFRPYDKVIGRVVATNAEHTTIKYDETKKIIPDQATFPTENVRRVIT
jgi:uncharacterized radical SAM superfamily Fe-S cluster-containing enzyme